MEKVKCLLCNEEHQIFWEEHGFSWQKCFKYNFIYLSSQPDKEDTEYHSETNIKKKTAQDYLRPNMGKVLMAQHTLFFIKQLKKDGYLLEIGPGGGEFLLCARKEGFNTFAVEIDRTLADYLTQNLNITVENCSASSDNYFESQSFDIIYHKDVLSHLQNPINSFKTFYDKLKDDGILVFETGNVGEIDKPWTSFIKTVWNPDHLFLFSIKSVKFLLDLSGFELIRYRYYSIVPYQLVSKIFKRKKKTINDFNGSIAGDMNVSIAQKIKWYIAFFLVYHLGRFLPKNWPSTVIYVAKKK
jgi:2-polyprenyl-3-methyl-5-hydroxy-6-metoxy-1,4-benzoquinol methylase